MSVFVPGTGTVLAGVPGQIDHIGRLQRAAEREAKAGENVAVISWLGYETPEWLNGSVAGTDRGDAGAPDLRNFTKGLRVTQAPDICGHLTVMAHSYGTYVVGAAAREGGGVNADDIISLGSPGMGVDKASELNIDPKHVWVGTARDDFIQMVTGTVLGEGPQYRSFGAQRIEIDTSGHGGYWNTGADGNASESLANQGRIIVGRPPTLVPQLPH